MVEVPVFNVVAELRGSEPPNGYVVLSAHDRGRPLELQIQPGADGRPRRWMSLECTPPERRTPFR